MKNLFTIILIALGLSLSAQERGDSRAVMQFESKDQAFSKALAVLTAEGFSIQVAEKDAGIITTQGKAGGRFQSKYNVHITEEGLLTLTGLMTIGEISLHGVTDTSWSRIEYRGMKGSPIRKSWEELESIAQQISDEVTYE